MRRKYNPLVIDMAGMDKKERLVLRLHAHYQVSVADLAEAFEMVPAEVRHLLSRARRKYRTCSRWLRIS